MSRKTIVISLISLSLFLLSVFGSFALTDFTPSNNIDMKARNISNVTKICYADGTCSITATAGGGGGGSIVGVRSLDNYITVVNSSVVNISANVSAFDVRYALVSNILTLAQIIANIGNWTQDRGVYINTTNVLWTGNTTVVKNLVTENTSLWSNASTQQAQINSMPNLSLANINTNMDNWSASRANYLNTTNSLWTTNVSNFNTSISNLNTKVSNLETANTSLNASVSNLNTAVSNLQSANVTLNAKVTALNTSIGNSSVSRVFPLTSTFRIIGGRNNSVECTNDTSNNVNCTIQSIDTNTDTNSGGISNITVFDSPNASVQSVYNSTAVNLTVNLTYLKNNCAYITGGAALCDGDDAAGAGSFDLNATNGTSPQNVKVTDAGFLNIVGGRNVTVDIANDTTGNVTFTINAIDTTGGSGDNASWNESKAIGMFLEGNGTLTGAKWCVWNGGNIDCNVNPVVDTNSGGNMSYFFINNTANQTQVSNNSKIRLINGTAIDLTVVNDSINNTNITISHSDTSSQASVDNSGNTVIQDITVDTDGHVTALTSALISGNCSVSGSCSNILYTNAIFMNVSNSRLNITGTYQALNISIGANTITGTDIDESTLSGTAASLTCGVATIGTNAGNAGWLNTTNQVILANNNTNVSINSNGFFDNTNNRVGIGMRTPNTVLEVNGSTNITRGNLSVEKDIILGNGTTIVSYINAVGNDLYINSTGSVNITNAVTLSRVQASSGSKFLCIFDNGTIYKATTSCITG